MCDIETSRIGAPYIYDISRLRVKHKFSDSHGGSIYNAVCLLGFDAVYMVRIQETGPGGIKEQIFTK